MKSQLQCSGVSEREALTGFDFENLDARAPVTGNVALSGDVRGDFDRYHAVSHVLMCFYIHFMPALRRHTNTLTKAGLKLFENTVINASIIVTRKQSQQIELALTEHEHCGINVISHCEINLRCEAD